MSIKKSSQVAMGGVCTALCLVLMFLTGMVPMSTFALPALAGLVLIVVAVEMGRKTALLVYAATALLCIFVVPDVEASMLFVFFFGYYPIIKPKLDGLPSRVLGWIIKLAVYNGAVVAAYLCVIYLFGLTQVLEQTGPLGQYSLWILLGLANVIFLLYDVVIKRMYILYLCWFRPKFLHRVH